jgi:hypothetical protein
VFWTFVIHSLSHDSYVTYDCGGGWQTRNVDAVSVAAEPILALPNVVSVQW